MTVVCTISMAVMILAAVGIAVMSRMRNKAVAAFASLGLLIVLLCASVVFVRSEMKDPLARRQRDLRDLTSSQGYIAGELFKARGVKKIAVLILESDSNTPYVKKTLQYLTAASGAEAFALTVPLPEGDGDVRARLRIEDVDSVDLRDADAVMILFDMKTDMYLQTRLASGALQVFMTGNPDDNDVKNLVMQRKLLAASIPYKSSGDVRPVHGDVHKTFEAKYELIKQNL